METFEHVARRLDWLLPSWLEDVSAYDQSIDENMLTVGYTVAVNIIILVFCLLFFSAYRMYHTRIFAPKADLMPERTPPKLSNATLFGWIRELIDIGDDVVIEKAGYDILFFLRFYRLAFRIFSVFLMYAAGILLPVNATGRGFVDNNNTFELWSMTNLKQGSERLWFHLVGIYLLTSITIYFLEKEFVVYAKYRHLYLRRRHAYLRTVLVEGIPNKMRSTVTLATYFETLYPNSVLSVKLGQDLRYLDRLVSQRQTAVTMLERCMYANYLGYRRPTVRVGNMSEGIDATRYYYQMLNDLNAAIAKEQEAANARASYVDRLSGTNAFAIIEGFLQVTEIGSLKKLLKKRSAASAAAAAAAASKGVPIAKNKESSLSSASSAASVSSLVRGMAQEPEKDALIEEVEAEGDDTILSYQSGGMGGMSTISKDTDNGPVSGSAAAAPENQQYVSLLNVYKMSRKEWLWAIWTAPTWWDAWQLIKDGRHQVDHRRPDSTSLISPPEERRMFLSKAFITFKTFTAATIARQVVHMQLAGHMAISEAPEPTDVTWVNMYVTRTGQLWRRFIVEAAVLFLIVVWVAPVTLISFVVSEDSLRGDFPFIDVWCQHSVLFESLIELLQPGALVALMNLLPPILTALAIFEGCISFSENQFRSFDRYFTFQVINVFLVTTIAGSVIDCLKEIYEDPKSAFSLLGDSLPRMGAFFTNYLVIKAFTGLGIEIIRLPAMFSALLKFLFTSNLTPRDRNFPYFFGSIRSMSNPGWFPFAKIYAQDTLLVVVCATYACIAPLSLIPGLCYFWGASIVYKHQMLYVYEPLYETGGKWWPKIARCIVVALLFAQSTMVGMFILKGAYTQIYFLVVIILGTSLYYWYIAKTYEPLASQLPFDMATAIDLDQQDDPEDLAAGADEYIQPSLREGIVYPEVEFSHQEIIDKTAPDEETSLIRPTGKFEPLI